MLTVGGKRTTACHVQFIPFVTESLGGWSEETTASIYSSIGYLLGQRLDQPMAKISRNFFQRFAISLSKGNANLWICRLPVHSPFIEGSL